MRNHRPLLFSLLWTVLVAFFFANVEIAIEGSAGWAANLPTWRIEHHWLLDIFWGGRPMTGYHAWVFPFVGLLFHFPFFLRASWSLKEECRVLSCIVLFWLSEDYLWFVLNPAFGISKFSPEFIPWHKHWFLFAPNDYWVGTLIILTLVYFSDFRRRGHAF